MPVFASDVVACTVSTAVDDDAHDDEDLRENMSGVSGERVRDTALTTMVMTLSRLSQYSSY